MKTIKTNLINQELRKRFAEIGDQYNTKDPLVIAKFFNPCGAGTWYAISYYPATNICFGYVTGLAENEMGDFSIDELESVRLRFGLTIERDIYFKESLLSEIMLKEPS